jgi:hypothetical protein
MARPTSRLNRSSAFLSVERIISTQLRLIRPISSPATAIGRSACPSRRRYAASLRFTRSARSSAKNTTPNCPVVRYPRQSVLTDTCTAMSVRSADFAAPGGPIQLDVSPRAITFLMSHCFGGGSVRSEKKVSFSGSALTALAVLSTILNALLICSCESRLFIGRPRASQCGV